MQILFNKLFKQVLEILFFCFQIIDNQRVGQILYGSENVKECKIKALFWKLFVFSNVKLK